VFSVTTQGVVRTGIPLLDGFLRGGLKEGTISAYWSEVEVEASALALQTLYNRIKENSDRGLLLTTTKKPKQVLQTIKEFGFDEDDFLQKVEFIDGLASSPKADLPEKYSLKANADLEELFRVVRDAIITNPASRTLFVFDSFSAYVDRFEDPMKVISFLPKFVSMLSEHGATGLFVFTEWSYDKELLDNIRKLFSNVVELKATSETPVYAMKVSTPEGKIDSGNLAFFKVLRPGGVKIYLPKIVVTGPFHAGKTSFIHSAGSGAISADRLGTTVALDYAHVDHKGFTIDLFGTPGQSRFDPLIEKLGSQALGVILFVSATDPRGLSRVREQFKLIKAEGLPFVLAVNKVNLRGAISVQAVRHLLGVPRRVPVIPLRAKDLSKVKPGEPCELAEEDVQTVLDKIVSLISKSEKSM
jgi:uncharacterized protein